MNKHINISSIAFDKNTVFLICVQYERPLLLVQ